MRSWNPRSLATLAALAWIGCGGGEPAADETMAESETAAAETAETAEMGEAAGELSAVDWITVDEDARTVTIQLVAGQTEANNRWNFNGHANGDATVVVPEGYTVTIEFSNQDPVNPHSVAVLDQLGDFPVQFTDPQPAFEGAMSSNPTDMQASTLPNESETITFTANAAGDYSLACLIPAHAATGMWIGFTVSTDGSAGLRM